MLSLKRTAAVLLFVIGATAAPAKKPSYEPKLEVVATLTQGPGNIAVTPDGRIILSQHQFYSPELRVVELLKDGRTVAFPNDRWARAPRADGFGLDSVLGIRSDRNGVVWMLDNGGETPRVVAWSTRANELYRIIPIPAPATRPGSFHNDLAVDDENGTLFVADFGGDRGPAMVVLDLKTGKARRVLEGHPSVQAENIETLIEGRPPTQKQSDGSLRDARVGLNPITIDAKYEWVFYGGMHSDDLWRIRTRDLRDEKLSNEELGRRVQRYGTKAPSDGISIDVAGNVYVTDITKSAIGVTKLDGTYRTLVQDDERLAWPDGISAGADGWMYATVNKLHRSATLSGGEDRSKPPYYVVRFKPISPAAIGR